MERSRQVMALESKVEWYRAELNRRVLDVERLQKLPAKACVVLDLHGLRDTAEALKQEMGKCY